MNIPAMRTMHSCRHLLVLAVLLCCGCSSDDSLPAVDYVVTDHIIYTTDITFDDAVAYMVQDFNLTDDDVAPYRSKIAALRLLTRDYRAYAVAYHTVDPQGRPTVASGMVYYPKTGRPRGVIEVSPVNKCKLDCATRAPLTAEMMPGLLGYVVILPDLVGCGASDHLPISYMQHDNVARVSADLRRAAAEVVQNEEGRQLPAASILFGYSLGGSATWSLARHYAQHSELGVTVTDVYAGGGAYDPAVAVEAFAASRYSDYAILPNIIYSMDYYDQLQLDFTRIFRGPLLDNYTAWCGGDVPIAELTRRLGTDMTQYLDFDFFDTSNPDFVRLVEVARSKAVPNDWVPTARVHLYHSREDTYVPRACSDSLYHYLTDHGVSVDYVLMDEAHVRGGLVMGLAFIETLAKGH